MNPEQPAPIYPTPTPSTYTPQAPNIAHPAATEESDKNYIMAVGLSVMFGFLGVDRFYLGQTVIGVIKLLTLGGLGIWALIDIILIIFGKVSDQQGRQLTGYELNRKPVQKLFKIYLAVVVAYFAVVFSLSAIIALLTASQ